MSKKKNRYSQKAKKKHFLSGMNEELPTKGNAKNTLLETGKDILIGVLGGGLIGAVIGKPSLAVGIITTGAGHYTDNKLIQLLGIGMMAANGFQKIQEETWNLRIVSCGFSTTSPVHRTTQPSRRIAQSWQPRHR